MIKRWENIAILILLALIFGARRIPDIAHGPGKLLKEFRKSFSPGGEDGPGLQRVTACLFQRFHLY